MSIDINLKNDIDTDFWEVSVAGELDVSTADEFKEYLHKLIDKGIRNIILDLESLDYIDSTGLGVIIGILKRIKVVAERKGLNVSALTRLLLINYVENCENEENERLDKSKS